MAVKLEFYLSDDDYDRLLALGKKEGKDNMYVNDYAKDIVENYLYKHHPQRVVFDEDTGEIIQ